MSNLYNAHVELSINTLTEKGYGEGEWDGCTMRILGALPGESVTARLFRKTKGVWYGRAEEIHEASSDRTGACEEHYQSCSPWQILEMSAEEETKKKYIREYFSAQEIDAGEFELSSSANEFRYRNKLEFSFYVDEDGELQLAFNKRGSKKGKYPVHGCVLAPEAMNEAARSLRDVLRTRSVEKHQLKSLQVRYSVTTETVILLLFVTEPGCISEGENLLSELSLSTGGLHIYYSDPKSPASTFTGHLLAQGQYVLEEEMEEFTFWYPAHGFFQVNPPAFEVALRDVRSYIKDLAGHTVLDLYAGVGTLSVPLAADGAEVTGVDFFPEAGDYAHLNARENGVENFIFYEARSERAVKETIPEKDILLLDPPRSGLHPKIIKRIHEYRPPHIVYLSCNPKTQAMDIAQFKDLYEITWVKAYNFYPHTPHVENLVCLKLR